MKDTRQEPNLLTQGTASAAPYYFICVCARPLMSFAPHQITDTGKQEYTLHIPLAESRKVGSERRAVGAVLPAGRGALRNPKRLIPCSLAF